MLNHNQCSYVYTRTYVCISTLLVIPVMLVLLYDYPIHLLILGQNTILSLYKINLHFKMQFAIVCSMSLHKTIIKYYLKKDQSLSYSNLYMHFLDSGPCTVHYSTDKYIQIPETNVII